MLRVISLLLATVLASTPAHPAEVRAPSWWAELELQGLDGRPAPFPGGWIAVVFLSSECPVANQYLPVLNALARTFAGQPVALLGVYCDPHETTMALRRHASEYGVEFALALDREQRLVRRAGATYTPEAVVFSPEGRVLYRGRIDDRVGNFGGGRPAALHADLRDVVAALLAGQTGPFAGRAGFGCAISRKVSPP